MKTLLRHFLIHLVSFWVTAKILPGLTYAGGIRTLALGTVGLMLINIMVVPLLKVMFLPLNILTLGLFTWVINVVGLYILTQVIPQIRLVPFDFMGANLDGFRIPEMQFNVLMVAVATSFLIGFISHFLTWLSK